MYDRLTKTYKKHLTRLQRTGEGICDDDRDSTSEELDYYIPADGPDATTPAPAVNLWRKSCFYVVRGASILI